MALFVMRLGPESKRGENRVRFSADSGCRAFVLLSPGATGRDTGHD